MSSPNPDDFAGELDRRARAHKETVERALIEAEERAQPGLRTRAALEGAATCGRNDGGGPLSVGGIRFRDAEWAPFILEAGRAFKEYPGFDALDRWPIPEDQEWLRPGIDAGIRIFRMAAEDGATEAKIEEELARCRSALREGTFPTGAHGFRKPHNPEVGIWVFFRQLDRFFDGVNWQPPSRTIEERAKQAAEAAAQSAERRSLGGMTFKRHRVGSKSIEVEESRMRALRVRGELTNLSESESAVLASLLSSKDEYWRSNKELAAVWNPTNRPHLDPTSDARRQVIRTLNLKLRACGVEAQSQTRPKRGYGYHLVEAP